MHIYVCILLYIFYIMYFICKWNLYVYMYTSCISLSIAGFLFCLYCQHCSYWVIIHPSTHLFISYIWKFYLFFFYLAEIIFLTFLLPLFFFHKNTSTDWQTFLFWKILLAITLGRWYDKNNDVEAVTAWGTWLNFCVSRSDPWWLSPILSW